MTSLRPVTNPAAPLHGPAPDQLRHLELSHERFLAAAHDPHTDSGELTTAFVTLAGSDNSPAYVRFRARRLALLERHDLTSGDLVVVLGHRIAWLEEDEICLAVRHPAWDICSTVSFLDRALVVLGLASTTNQLVEAIVRFGEDDTRIASAVHAAVANDSAPRSFADRIALTLGLVEQLEPFGRESLTIFEGLLEDWNGTIEELVAATVAVLSPTTPASS